MATITYYVALPFIRATDGTLTAEQAEECPNPDVVRRRAAGMARAKGGAVAFTRSGDPDIGEFGDAVILGKFGDVPEDLSEL